MCAASQAPDIPSDVADAIIDIIHGQEDNKSLFSMSEVSRVWYPRTRKYLYEHLQLVEGARPSKKYEDLKDVLTVRPDLSDQVKRLSIVLNNSSNRDVSSRDFLPELLPHLTSVEVLEISGGQYELNWGALPNRVRAALLTLVSKSTTTSVSLSNICGFPVEKLAHCTNIRKLSLVRVAVVGRKLRSWDHSIFPSPTSDPGPDRVDPGVDTALTLDGSFNAMCAILRESHLSSVVPPFMRPKALDIARSLHHYPIYDDHSPGWRTWQAFVHCWIPSVEILKLTGVSLSWGVTTHLEKYRRLRKIQVTLPSVTSTTVRHAIEEFLTNLSLVSPSSALESVDIGFDEAKDSGLGRYEGGNHKSWARYIIVDLPRTAAYYLREKLHWLKAIRFTYRAEGFWLDPYHERSRIQCYGDWNTIANSFRAGAREMWMNGNLMVEFLNPRTGDILRNLDSPIDTYDTVRALAELEG